MGCHHGLSFPAATTGIQWAGKCREWWHRIMIFFPLHLIRVLRTDGIAFGGSSNTPLTSRSCHSYRYIWKYKAKNSSRIHKRQWGGVKKFKYCVLDLFPCPIMWCAAFSDSTYDLLGNGIESSTCFPLIFHSLQSEQVTTGNTFKMMCIGYSCYIKYLQVFCLWF